MSLQDLLENSMTAREFYLLSDEEIYKCEWLQDDGEWYGLDSRCPVEVLIRCVHNLRQGIGQLEENSRLLVRVATGPIKTNYTHKQTFEMSIDEYEEKYGGLRGDSSPDEHLEDDSDAS